jgi:hypothetical protein
MLEPQATLASVHIQIAFVLMWAVGITQPYRLKRWRPRSLVPPCRRRVCFSHNSSTCIPRVPDTISLSLPTVGDSARKGAFLLQTYARAVSVPPSPQRVSNLDNLLGAHASGASAPSLNWLRLAHNTLHIYGSSSIRQTSRRPHSKPTQVRLPAAASAHPVHSE